MKKIFYLIFLFSFVAGVILFAGCATTGTTTETTTTTTATTGTTTTSVASTSTTTTSTTTTLAFSVSSSGFSNNGFIPYKYAYTGVGTGENKSIPLSWSNAPAGTQSYALSMRDTSASNFVHWQVVNIPSDVSSLAENTSATGMPSGSTQYLNDYGTSGYGGPAPPSGETHAYVTTIYALNGTVEAMVGMVSYEAFVNALSGKIVGQASITGKFTGP